MTLVRSTYSPIKNIVRMDIVLKAFFERRATSLNRIVSELKIKMIEQATKDAKNRAETIAKNGGGSLGDLTKANMGVFQITAENSSDEYSWGGSFNTSSKRKTASITMRLNYEID